MANNWHPILSDDDQSWFTQEWTGQVEQDASSQYDVIASVEQDSAEVDYRVILAVTSDKTAIYQIATPATEGTGPNWFARLDGTYNAWEPIRLGEGGTTPVEQDSATVSYDIFFSVYQSSVALVYQVESVIGYISGGGELYYGTVERDAEAQYVIYSLVAVEKDVTDTYRILNYAENTKSDSWRILTSATQDSTQTYALNGFAQADKVSEYDLFSTVERDRTDTYNVVAAVTQDASPLYHIITSPLTAGNNAVTTYQVWAAVQNERVLRYRLLNAVERDVVDTYNVKSPVQEDKEVTYLLAGYVQEDQSIVYDVLGLTSVQQDASVRYAISSFVLRIPNIVGMPLSKAIDTLERAGFRLGTTTYT